MIERLPDGPPAQPRLRAVDAQWVVYGRERLVMLRDRLGIAPEAAFLPAAAAPLLSLCDGSRDLRELCAAYALRTNRHFSRSDVAGLLEQLDAALFLEGPRFEAARAAALAEFRGSAHRPMTLAPHGYPDDPAELARTLDAHGNPASIERHPDPDAIVGLVSPHIDYGRGGPVYARTWWRAAEAVCRAEVAVILATDHNGGAGRVTPTRQRFLTPYGVLPTDVEAVEAVADAVGRDWAFEEELHHRLEHSIELVAVWLHHVRRGVACPIVPILVGGFHRFVGGDGDPAADPRFAAAVAALRTVTAGRRALVVVSGDLAHVGPAFGDAERFGTAARRRLAEADGRLLDDVRSGDAAAFFGRLRAEQDRRKVCGLPPTYLALRCLGACRGEVAAYDQCPADDAGESWVTIAGAILTRTDGTPAG